MSAVGLRLRLGGGAGVALRPVVHLLLDDGNWACLERRLQGQGDSRCVCPDGKAWAALQRGGERSAERGTLSVGTACLMGVVCCVVGDSLPPPPGWRCILPAWLSPHVADTQVGEIRGYARLPPPPGWRKCPSLAICLCLAEMELFVVADSLPPPPGWRFLCASRRPGMSPTPRSAKYPATHGCHHLRGGGNVRLWSSVSAWQRWSVLW